VLQRWRCAALRGGFQFFNEMHANKSGLEVKALPADGDGKIEYEVSDSDGGKAENTSRGMWEMDSSDTRSEEDDVERVTRRFKRLNMTSIDTIGDAMGRMIEEAKAKKKAWEASEEGRKEIERERLKREGEERYKYERARPWEDKSGLEWLHSRNYTHDERQMLLHYGVEDDLDPEWSADELDHAGRTYHMDYQQFAQDRKLRKYFPERWKRRVELRNDTLLEEEHLHEFQRKRDRHLNISRLKEEPNATMPLEAALGLYHDLSDKRRIENYNNFEQDKIFEQYLDRWEDEALFDNPGLGWEGVSKQKKELREAWQKARYKERHEYDLTPANYRAKYPKEAKLPRRVTVQSNWTWMLDVYVDLAKVLTDMKLKDHITAKKAFISLSYYVKRLHKNPYDPQHRVIAISDLHPMPGVRKFLIIMGFEQDGHHTLRLPDDRADIYVYRSAMEHLEEALNNKYFGMFEAEERYEEMMKAKNVEYDASNDEEIHLPGYKYTTSWDDTEDGIRKENKRIARIRQEKEDFGLSESQDMPMSDDAEDLAGVPVREIGRIDENTNLDDFLDQVRS